MFNDSSFRIVLFKFTVAVHNQRKDYKESSSVTFHLSILESGIITIDITITLLLLCLSYLEEEIRTISP